VCRSENVIQMEPKRGCVLDSARLGEGPETVTCEHENESPGSVQCGLFFDHLSFQE
jgi:hypothetical protein